MNEEKFMRVMVSLNLADIMTATRPTTQQEVDPTGPGQESQLTTNSEQNRTADNADEIRI
jgi:hypothetical protein